jgi:hypothetical protein
MGVAAWEALECEVDPAHCKSKQAHRPSDPPIELLPTIDTAGLPSARPAGLVAPHAIPGHTPEQIAAEEEFIHSRQWLLPVLYALVGLLTASNIVLCVLLRRGSGKSVASCIPASLSHALSGTQHDMHKQV